MKMRFFLLTVEHTYWSRAVSLSSESIQNELENIISDTFIHAVAARSLFGPVPENSSIFIFAASVTDQCETTIDLALGEFSWIMLYMQDFANLLKSCLKVRILLNL